MKIPTIVRWVIAITVALLVCDRVLSQKAGGRSDRTRERARQFDRGSSKRPQISYRAAVFAIAHCLGEVGVPLEGRKRKQLISRVLSVPLAGRAEPYGSSDVLIDYEVTVSAFARELEEQRAVTGCLIGRWRNGLCVYHWKKPQPQLSTVDLIDR